jgi:N6-L-threonylcarbamoyladenine synthase
MLILGIETSCDETAVALFDTNKGLLSHSLRSQVALHAPYGGVVPEIASRDHLRCLLPLIKKILVEANVKKPDVIAYTAGPGLIGALMVGGGLANGLALAWKCKVIPIHHMEGHLLAPMLEEDKPEYPFLALLVSGGHSLLVAVNGLGRYEILGTTLDDAIGEAFDKVAKLLDLTYPGGPEIAKLAKDGDSEAYLFPRPMLKKPGLNFSFSGLKTAVMLVVRQAEKDGTIEKNKPDIAASFQKAAIDTLIGRTLKAAKIHNFERVVVAGGVGANIMLRQNLKACFDGSVFYPRHEFCTDNAAMIAVAGAYRLAEAQEANEIKATARWSLESINT